MSKPKKLNLSRRDFIKGAAMATGAGILAGCAPKVAGTLTPTEAPAGPSAPAAAEPGGGGMPFGNPATPATAPAGYVLGYTSQVDWLGKPPVIADADIADTKDVEFLVIGAGHAGLMAALSAVELGKKTAIIEKRDEAGFYTDYWHRVGEDIGHVNSKWLIDRGYGPYDTGEIVDEFVKRSGGRVDPRLIKMYVENSGAMFDHMVEIYKSYEDLRKERFSKVEFTYIGENPSTVTYDFSNMMSEEMLFNQTQKGLKGSDYPIELNGYKTWPTNAMFQGPVLHQPVMPFVSALRYFETFMDQKVKDLGGEYYYEHTAIVLTQDESGAVTGAVVQNKEGKYIKFAASKGVLVATGDFGANSDMCWALINDQMEWAERAGKARGQLAGMYQDGAGHKMCCWAGGMIEPLPRPTMGMASAAGGPWGMTPMLQLNADAKRYANEAAICWLGHVALRQPKGLLTSVTDSKYMDSITIAGLDHGGPNFGRGDLWEKDFQEDMAKVMGTGSAGSPVRGITVAERNASKVYGANTLEELAGYLGYEGALAKTFVDSINRYNELCKSGFDADYGKDPKALIPIDTPPFYGVVGQNSGQMSIGLVTLAGMLTDENLNVLNKEGKPIKGLYVAGNTLGGRYGEAYVTPYAGNSVGMALTHGWLVGKTIAAL
ncbi:MAG TPA: FAD-binding protein [Anaerolineaceae bacterium]|nr:FAD-binding protein [Anaerolineaceae bacterium]